MHEASDAVPRRVVAGDVDSARIDIAGQHLATQQLRCSDRQNPGAGSNVERPAKPAMPRETLESQQTTAGRRMLARAKRCRGIHRNPNRPRRRPPAIMRAVNEKPADLQGRKRQLVFRHPIAGRQGFFCKRDQSSARRSRDKREPCLELDAQQRRLAIRLQLPLVRQGLGCRYGIGARLEEREARIRRLGTTNVCDQTPDGIHAE